MKLDHSELKTIENIIRNKIKQGMIELQSENKYKDALLSFKETIREYESELRCSLENFKSENMPIKQAMEESSLESVLILKELFNELLDNLD